MIDSKGSMARNNWNNLFGCSVVDAESLRQAEEVLHFLWRHSLTSASTPLLNVRQQQQSSSSNCNTTQTSSTQTSSTSQPLQPSPVTTTPSPPQLLLPPPPPVIILVANKIDLVRSRIISPQGIHLFLYIDLDCFVFYVIVIFQTKKSGVKINQWETLSDRAFRQQAILTGSLKIEFSFDKSDRMEKQSI